MEREEVPMSPDVSQHSHNDRVVVDGRAGIVPLSRDKRGLGTRGTRDTTSNEN